MLHTHIEHGKQATKGVEPIFSPSFVPKTLRNIRCNIARDMHLPIIYPTEQLRRDTFASISVSFTPAFMGEAKGSVRLGRINLRQHH